MPLEERCVVEADRGSAHLPGDHLAGIGEVVTVMGSVTRMGHGQRDLAAPPRPADTLCVVGWSRRQVPQYDAVEVVQAYADFKRWGARERVDDRMVAIVEPCFEAETLLALHLAGVLANDEPAGLGLILLQVEVPLRRGLPRRRPTTALPAHTHRLAADVEQHRRTDVPAAITTPKRLIATARNNQALVIELETLLAADLRLLDQSDGVQILSECLDRRVQGCRRLVEQPSGQLGKSTCVLR